MTRILAIACGVLVALLVLQTGRVNDAKQVALQRAGELASLRATHAEAQARAEAAARDTEHRLMAAAAQAEANYQKGIEHAQRESDRVIADLRSGALRLRDEWAGCETSRLSEGASAARQIGDAERRRSESAQRIVRAAAECDAHVAALIADAHAVRALINAEPAQ